MRDDFLEEFGPKIKEEFFKSISETVKLLGLKELESFKLGIDYEDTECQDLILKIREKTDKERIDTIFQEGYSIIRRYFKYQKEKELIDKLYSINKKYSKKDKEVSRAAYTAIILLEDKVFDKARLPLLNALLSLELFEMEEELFSDPEYFANRGKNCLNQNKFEEANKFFLLERQVDNEHWSSYESMAELYYKQGRKEEAKEQINEALKRVYKCWREAQETLDFEVVEELEEKADGILARNRTDYLIRLSQYACGLLYFLGAAPLDTIINEVKNVSGCKNPFSKEELLYYLKDVSRLKIDGELVYLKEIEDPHLIIKEFSRRGLKQRSPYSLSALKLAQEGRINELFFTLDEDNKEIDKDLRRLTDGELNLVQVYEELRKDVAGRKHHDLLVNKLLSKGNPHLQEIVEIFTHVWNHLPRWELGGRISFELAKQRKAKGLPPQLHTHITSFEPPVDIPQQTKKKIGRNEPCPCGSGKKYKKCCGR